MNISTTEISFLQDIENIRAWQPYALGHTKNGDPVAMAMIHLNAAHDPTANVIIQTVAGWNEFFGDAFTSPDFYPMRTVYVFPTITPAMAAVIFKNHGALKTIMSHPLFSVDEENAAGWTTLQLAAHLKNADAVRMLLDAGADPFRQVRGSKLSSAHDVFAEVVRPHVSAKQDRSATKENRKASFARNQRNMQALAARYRAASQPPAAPAEMPDLTSVIGKLSTLAFDNILMKHGVAKISVEDKAKLHLLITQNDRDDLLPVYNHRCISNNGMSDIAYHRMLSQDEAGKATAQGNDTALLDVFMQQRFTLNLAHMLRVHGDRLGLRGLNRLSAHMAEQNRTDMVQMVSDHQKQYRKRNNINKL